MHLAVSCWPPEWMGEEERYGESPWPPRYSAAAKPAEMVEREKPEPRPALDEIFKFSFNSVPS